MNIVAFRTLRAFYEKHEDCEMQLKTWYKKAISDNWKSPKEIKSDYPSASIIVDNRVVFNIKGNEYRLIVKFNYIFSQKSKALLNKFVMSYFSRNHSFKSLHQTNF